MEKWFLKIRYVILFSILMKPIPVKSRKLIIISIFNLTVHYLRLSRRDNSSFLFKIKFWIIYFSKPFSFILSFNIIYFTRSFSFILNFKYYLFQQSVFFYIKPQCYFFNKPFSFI